MEVLKKLGQPIFWYLLSNYSYICACD